jgi:general secretion pathway protein G
MQLLTKKKGFTLIELLVVIFIIGILTAVVLPNLMGARQRARDTRRKQDLEAVKSALRMYYNDDNQYPAANSWEALAEILAEGNYMTNVPTEAVEDHPAYVYNMTNSGEGFNLQATLEVTDASESQAACGLGSLDDNIFVVCAL